MFSFERNQQHTFPAVPPFLSAGDHETRDHYTVRDASRPSTNQAPYLTPYLGLRARLSQVWINRWTVLLLLVLVRTLFAIASINDDLAQAHAKALSACTSVESIGSAMASMPHYLSQGVNELAAHGVEKAVNGLHSLLMLSISGVEELVVFVINLLTSTYLCLITFAVSGSLHAALDLIKDVTDFLQKNLGSIGNDISTGVNDFTQELNKFISTLNSIPFVNDKIPTLNVTDDINKLKNLSLPSDLDADLQKLNASIPNFQEVNNLTTTAIRFPFEELKDLVNKTLGPFTFDRSVFPVPAKESLSFCTGNDGIDEFFDDLFTLAIKAKKIFLVLLIIGAILACIPMTYREIRRWRTMQKRALLVTKEASDPMDVVYIASRPYTAGFGIAVAGKFSSVRRQNLVRWVVAYATTTPALFVLSLGVAGLFSCLCQYLLLRAMQREAPQLETQVGAFADKVVNSLNNASSNWATGVNHAINKTNDDLNQNIFGWVNTTTTTLNNTLNTFVDSMSEGLNKTFGGTVLYDPITEVLNCLIGLKIQGIQKGLTWISDNAHVEFPSLPDNTFSLGAAASLTNDTSLESFLASPNSKSKDEISDAFNSLVSKFEAAIRQEAIISACVVIIWFIIVFVGLVRALMLFYGRDKTRAEGGQILYVDPVTESTQVREVYQENFCPPPEYKAAPTTSVPQRPFIPARSFSTEPASRGSHTTPSSNEKLGNVGAHNTGLAIASSSRQRASTHAHVANPTIIDEKSHDPFI